MILKTKLSNCVYSCWAASISHLTKFNLAFEQPYIQKITKLLYFALLFFYHLLVIGLWPVGIICSKYRDFIYLIQFFSRKHENPLFQAQRMRFVTWSIALRFGLDYNCAETLSCVISNTCSHHVAKEHKTQLICFGFFFFFVYSAGDKYFTMIKR